MDFEKLLQGRDCACGMHHACPIEHIIIGSGANAKLAGLLGDYKRIVLAADTPTYALCGREIEAQLGDRLQAKLVYVREGLLIPNEEAVGELEALVNEETDLIVGVGSGVIQDICKYVSFFRKLPYYIVATAPSMDGYASASAAMIMGGMKATFTAHVPKVIIGDIDILKDAPMEMIKSGYGDILGKFSCLNDWRLACIVREEYFCQEIYDLVHDMLMKTKDLGPKLLARDPQAIETLMEAIVGVGVAMAFVGNSRPASGSEHHMSHYYEIVSILRDEPYFMHGTDVVYSSIYSQRIREELLAIEAPEKRELRSREDWEANIRRIYGVIADSVIAQQDKMGWYNEDRYPIYKEKWAEIRAVLADAPSEKEMLGYLASIGLDIAEFDKLYGEKKIADALIFAKDLKDRFTVLWPYYDLLVG